MFRAEDLNQIIIVSGYRRRTFTKNAFVASSTYSATAEMPAIGTHIRPVEKLAAALAKCAPESAIYGRCVVADFNSVSKDKCLNEFMRLKDCYMVS